MKKGQAGPRPPSAAPGLLAPGAAASPGRAPRSRSSSAPGVRRHHTLRVGRGLLANVLWRMGPNTAP